MRESPRKRRLRSDLRALVRLKEESTIFDFTAFGDPPHTYMVRFRGRGLSRTTVKAPVTVRGFHEVRVELGASYPRLQPELAWQTPIFHPNISAGGVVCLGGYGTYWVPSLNLDELCEMLWDMIRYANFDVDSPYNREAAGWARIQSEFRLPVDPRPIRDNVAKAKRESQPPTGRVVPPPAAAPPPPSAGVARPIPVAEAVPARDDILFIDDEPPVAAEPVDDDSDILIIE